MTEGVEHVGMEGEDSNWLVEVPPVSRRGPACSATEPVMDLDVCCSRCIPFSTLFWPASLDLLKSRARNRGEFMPSTLVKEISKNCIADEGAVVIFERVRYSLLGADES
jgi:hypothetical protein